MIGKTDPSVECILKSDTYLPFPQPSKDEVP
jgi:hypothetical protein